MGVADAAVAAVAVVAVVATTTAVAAATSAVVDAAANSAKQPNLTLPALLPLSLWSHRYC